MTNSFHTMSAKAGCLNVYFTNHRCKENNYISLFYDVFFELELLLCPRLKVSQVFFSYFPRTSLTLNSSHCCIDKYHIVYYKTYNLDTSKQHRETD